MNRLFILIGIIGIVILLSLRKIYVDTTKEYKKIREIPIKTEGKIPEHKKNYTISDETLQILDEYEHDFYDSHLLDNDSGNNYPKNDFNFF